MPADKVPFLSGVHSKYGTHAQWGGSVCHLGVGAPRRSDQHKKGYAMEDVPPPLLSQE
jgi:hypothetical protein